MLRLKKTQPAPSAQPDATSAPSPTTTEPASSPQGTAPAEGNGSQGLSLLGIGGVSLASDPNSRRGRKRTPGEIRIQKDIAELDGGKVANVDFPNPNDLTVFTVNITPDSGYWMGATYTFRFQIPDLYPHDPPKVTCLTKIYHPNINLQGNVCLNILRDDWKPVLDINSIIYGLIFLFHEPNPDDPLNREAADLFRTNRDRFRETVKNTLKGHSVGNETFPKLI